MSDEKIYIPPFKTQGIKTKLVPLIKQKVYIDDETLWIEPFMGSGVVGLNIAPKRAVFADINPHIIEFYNKLKNRTITTSRVFEYLNEQGAKLAEKGDEYYYFVRERFNQSHDPLDFLFLNRSCFNGMIRFNKNNDFNVPFGHKTNRFSKAYVTKIINQVRHFEDMLKYNDWTFLCQPFETTIAEADSRAFIYCDPPYIGRHVDYYDSWSEQNETQLKQLLFEAGSRFMLSTWDNNQYRENQYIDLLWDSCYKVTQEHFYFVGAKEKNRNAMTEALLTNYEMPERTPVIFAKSQEYEQISLMI